MSVPRTSLDELRQVFAKARSSGERRSVYFVQAETGGLIKIGIAMTLESRLWGLQCQCPVALRLLAATPGYADEERIAHLTFADARRHGEWFEPVPELLRLIIELASGSELSMPTKERRGPSLAEMIDRGRQASKLQGDVNRLEGALRRSEQENERLLVRLMEHASEPVRPIAAIAVNVQAALCIQCEVEEAQPGEKYCMECSHCACCGSTLYEGEDMVCDDCETDALLDEGRCMECGQDREDQSDKTIFCNACGAAYRLQESLEEVDAAIREAHLLADAFRLEHPRIRSSRRLLAASMGIAS